MVVLASQEQPIRWLNDARRRGMIAKVQIGRKELDLEDDDYRAILKRVTSGKTSAKDCSSAELARVLDEFKAKGWTPTTGANLGRRKPADHPAAKKARALWLSLGLLGAVRDPSEQALEAFAARQLNVERLQWSDQARVYKLIEALKAMAERAGWSQSLAHVHPQNFTRTLKRRLVEAIYARLRRDRVVGPGISLAQVANDLTGITGTPILWNERELDLIARALGDVRAKYGKDAANP